MVGMPQDHSSAGEVFIVDDDPGIRALVSRALAGEYAVRTAESATVAANLLGGGFLPDLILLDVMMPGFDGLAFADALKKDPKSRQIPIIFLTALGSPKDVIRGINAGAKHYITKPFSLDDLRAKVKKLLK
jgi:DNA-binding response OmpR family regulator